MAIYEINADSMRRVEETSFGSQGVRERRDLQRLLRSQIDIVSPHTLVIAEEFGEWEDSKRRIDLLGLDREANLVVIELKRTEDGGHMELQAVRYAAMISAMTFDRAVEVYSQYLARIANDIDARSAILEFLDWDEPDEDSFAQAVRIVLASAEFSKELTTTVLWLNEMGLDIHCVRIKPYAYEGKILADVQQVIPLPEAEDYQIRIKQKHDRERVARKFNPDYTKYDVTVNGTTYSALLKRRAIFEVVRFLCSQSVSPESIAEIVPWRQNTFFRSADGKLNAEEFVDRMTAEDAAKGKTIEERRSNCQSRCYCQDGELIYAKDKTYAFTNMWGNRCIEAVDKIIAAFPDHQISCVKSPKSVEK